MIYPDAETARLFVRDRQDAYLLDAELARLARPLAEARRERRRRLRRQLRFDVARFITPATRKRRRPVSSNFFVRKENDVLQPDIETSRQLAREHQAELKRSWQHASPAPPQVVESRRRRPSLRLPWLRTQLRPADHTS